MAVRTYLPSREGELVTWSANMSALIGADPTIYGLTLGQATDFATLQTAYADAYTTANNDSTRTPASIVTKNDAKQALIDGPGGIRQLVNIIQEFPGTTNTMRANLQITIPDVEPSPIDPPSLPPDMKITKIFGRTITIKLSDAENPETRGKPANAIGATVFRYVGETAPSELSEWVFVGNTGKTNYSFDLPNSVESATQFWVTAFWFSPSKQSGPAATPIDGYTNFDGVSQAA